MKLMRLRSKKFSRSNSGNKMDNGGGSNNNMSSSPPRVGGDQIKWELRPGGMLVQKRDQFQDSGSNSSSCGSSDGGSGGEGMIALKVSTVSDCHYSVSVQSTSTFGELKLILSMVTNLEAKEQRLLYRGKEREDHEYLHMVGVRENDKVLLLEDPAVRERKLRMAAVGVGVGGEVMMGSPYRTISV